jgi:hypothetical protein
VQTTSKAQTATEITQAILVGVSATSQASYDDTFAFATVYAAAEGYVGFALTTVPEGALGVLTAMAVTSTRWTVVPQLLSSRSYSLSTVAYDSTGDNAALSWTNTFGGSSISWETTAASSVATTLTLLGNILPPATTLGTSTSFVKGTSSQTLAGTVSGVAVRDVVNRTTWGPRQTTTSAEQTYTWPVTATSSRPGISGTWVTTQATTQTTTVTGSSSFLPNYRENYTAESTIYVEGTGATASSRTFQYEDLQYSMVSSVTEVTTAPGGLVVIADAVSQSFESRSGVKLPTDLGGSAAGQNFAAGLAWPVLVPMMTAETGNVISPVLLPVPSATMESWSENDSYEVFPVASFAAAMDGNQLSVTRSSTANTIAGSGTATSSATTVVTESASANLSVTGAAATSVFSESSNVSAGGNVVVVGGPAMFSGGLRAARLGKGLYRSGTSVITRLTQSTTTSGTSVTVATAEPLYSVGGGVASAGPPSHSFNPPFVYRTEYFAEEEE